MLYVACSGFPLPMSQYWGLFPSVEISDTRLGIPGGGTVRRMLREAPDGFAFTAIASKEFGESGFRRSDENKALIEAFSEFTERLGAKAIVFEAPEEFLPTKGSKTALKSFLAWLPDTLPRIVLDLPGWSAAEITKAVGKIPVTVAYDPLNEEAPPAADFVYMRLPGPAGFRSRYDDESIEAIQAHCAGIEAKEAFCVFRNIDMQANCTALLDKRK